MKQEMTKKHLGFGVVVLLAALVLGLAGCGGPRKSNATTSTSIFGGGGANCAWVNSSSASNPCPLVLGTHQVSVSSGTYDIYYLARNLTPNSPYNIRVTKESGDNHIKMYPDATYTIGAESCISWELHPILDGCIANTDSQGNLRARIVNINYALESFTMEVNAIAQPLVNEGSTFSKVSVTQGVMHSGTVAPGGSSWYTAYITVSNFSPKLTNLTTDLDMYVYDNFNTLLFSSTQFGITSEVPVATSLVTPNTRIIKVFDKQGNGGTFDLTP